MSVQPSSADPALNDRLDRAAAASLFVRLHRWIPDDDVVEGFVVGRGAGWLLLAVVSDTIHLDGWTAVPLADVRAAEVVLDDESLPARALRARGSWPPAHPPAAVDLTDVTTVLTTIGGAADLLTVHRERLHEGQCWIGQLRGVADGRVALLEVDAVAEWRRAATIFELADVTQVSLGGAYEAALALVAGPPPDLG